MSRCDDRCTLQGLSGTPRTKKTKVPDQPARICFVTGPETTAVGMKIMNSTMVIEAMAEVLGDSVDEEVHILCVDAQNVIRVDYLVCRGYESGCNVMPQSIIRAVMVGGTRRFILVHNHPSGETRPSPEDIKFTEVLLKACKCTGLELLDHLVVGRDPRSREFTGTTLRDVAGHLWTNL